MKVLIIDNYDSFTYNLYQFIGEILTTEKNRGELPHFEIIVKRNNQIDFKAIEAMAPDRIIISPGPGSPDDPPPVLWRLRRRHREHLQNHTTVGRVPGHAGHCSRFWRQGGKSASADARQNQSDQSQQSLGI